MEDLGLPPDDTLAWCLERVLEHPTISDQAVADLVLAIAPGGDTQQLNPALQCRLSLRALEGLVRAGRLDQFAADSLVTLGELSGEMQAAGPGRLVCGDELLLEVRTAAFTRVLEERHLYREAQLLPYLEALFPRPLSAEARRRANEIVEGIASDEGREALMRRYPAAPVLAKVVHFIEQAKAALGPSVLAIINDDINAGRYHPGAAGVRPQPAYTHPAPAGAGEGPFSPSRGGGYLQPEPGQPAWQSPLAAAAAQQAQQQQQYLPRPQQSPIGRRSPVDRRATSGGLDASRGWGTGQVVQQQQQQQTPSRRGPIGSPAGSRSQGHRSLGGSMPRLGASPSPARSLRPAGGGGAPRAGAGAGGGPLPREREHPRKRPRIIEDDEDYGHHQGGASMSAGGRRSGFEGGGEECMVDAAAARLVEANDKLHEAGGQDPLPEALGLAAEAAAAAEGRGPQGTPERGGRDGEEVEEGEGKGELQGRPWRQFKHWDVDENDDQAGAPRMEFVPARRAPPALRAHLEDEVEEEEEELRASLRGAKGGGFRRKVGRWSEEETNTLIQLIIEYGEGNWAAMHQDHRAQLHMPGRTQVDLKDKWRNLRRAGYDEVVSRRRGRFLAAQRAKREELHRLAEQRLAQREEGERAEQAEEEGAQQAQQEEQEEDAIEEDGEGQQEEDGVEGEGADATGGEEGAAEECAKASSQQKQNDGDDDDEEEEDSAEPQQAKIAAEGPMPLEAGGSGSTPLRQAEEVAAAGTASEGLEQGGGGEVLGARRRAGRPRKRPPPAGEGGVSGRSVSEGVGTRTRSQQTRGTRSQGTRSQQTRGRSRAPQEEAAAVEPIDVDGAGSDKEVDRRGASEDEEEQAIEVDDD